MIGKVNDDFFQRYILPQTGCERPEIIIGPKMGVDAGILKLKDKYMAIAEDPIFPGPTTSPEDFAWITVHIGASDVAVMGIKPQFMTYSLLLPPGTSDEYISRLVNGISQYAQEEGIAIVGGHTGYYGSVTVPTIGGITVWGLGDSYISPAGAQVGDKIIITKGAAIEAAGILASEFEEKLIKEGIDPGLVIRAKKRFREMSVLADAQIAAAAGGVHAMHDATEGGLARGLWEVAEASQVGLRIDRSRVLVPQDVQVVCDYFNLDPYKIISEGTLVLSCEAEKAEILLKAFRTGGLDAEIIGEVVPLSAGRLWVEKDGKENEIIPPAVDEFWEVFFNSLDLKGDERSPKEKELCHELDEAVEKLQKTDAVGLIPEIGANLAYAFPEAQTLSDIAAIPGRLLRFKGQIYKLGDAEMGCSHYMGGSLLKIREYFSQVRCIINLRNNPNVLNACQNSGLRIADMPAVEGYRQDDSQFFRDLEKTLQGCEEYPQIIMIPDRMNLEKLILVMGSTLEELIDNIEKISSK